MQGACRGLIPSRVITINDENGEPCSTPTTQQQRWRRHFTKVLNRRSQYESAEMEKVRQREVNEDLGRVPSATEVTRALAKLKSGKAPGSSEILPDMLKVGRGNEDFREMIVDLVKAVWEERQVPQEWVDAILIPIPKKGNLHSCDNWRGISLLEVMGKVVARMIQNRLQVLAEMELPESQCGFRKGRGCVDMIFSIRQLTEKAVEHRAKQYLIFVDLTKAYDSVPREALWVALGKLGVPNQLIDIIRSFHDNMKAKLRLDGELLEEIEVENGLQQGCSMAPTLFNLYACVVAERWLDKVRDVDGIGTCLFYKFDQQLFRRYTRNASEDVIHKCEFADDVALLATSRAAAETAMKLYSSVASDFGLTVSVPKTKFMVVGYGVEEEELLPMSIDGGNIECVTEFPYLGSLIAANGRIDVEIDKRIANASKAFGALRQSVFKNVQLSITTKRQVYNACVLSVLLYGGECWIPLGRHLKRMNTFHHRCIRTMLGITNRQQWEQRISSANTREQWGDLETITVKLAKRRLEWLGHLARMPSYRIPKKTLFSWLPQTRPCGGPRRRWRDLLKRDMKEAGIPENSWYDEALHRGRWYEAYNQGLSDYQQRQTRGLSRDVECDECGRCFRREGDKARHKCTAERQRPVWEQRGAVQCTVCRRWFKSRGGLALHNCGSQPDSSTTTRGASNTHVRRGQRPVEVSSTMSQGVQCTDCGREFSRPSGLKRHKCLVERAKPIEEQRGSVRCEECGKWFLSRGGLALHSCGSQPDSSTREDNSIRANTRLRRGQRPVEVASAQRVQCIDCGRGFSRPGDLKRHKCLAERAKPVEEQSGAVQCEACKRWFRSRGGLALH